MNNDIFGNVRSTMKVENMDIKGFSEKLAIDFLNGYISEEEAVESIKNDILSRGEN